MTPGGYQELKELALDFVKQYAVEHQFFTGGDVLDAYRATGSADSKLDWRNRWGAVIKEGASREWYKRSGRVAPTTKQSHTSSLVQWQSNLFKGVQSLVGTTATDQLEAIRKDFVLRKLDARQALWKAYELGVEQGAQK